jgi:hypothetical protein
MWHLSHAFPLVANMMTDNASFYDFREAELLVIAAPSAG